MGANQFSFWEEASKDLDRAAIEKYFGKPLEVGQSLTFNFEGSKAYYKIMSLPKNGKIYIKRIYLTDPEDFKGHMGHAIDSSEKTQIAKGGPWCTDCEVLIGAAPVEQPSEETSK